MAEEIFNNGEMEPQDDPRNQELYGDYAQKILGMAVFNIDGIVVTIDLPVTHDQIVKALVEKKALPEGYDAQRFALKAVYIAGVTLGETVSELDYAKSVKLVDIDEYDYSGAVNSFTLDGKQAWIPREYREMFQARLEQEKRRGHETVTLDMPDAQPGDAPLTLSVEVAGTMLDALNDYATDCYDVTQAHKRAVAALTTVEEVTAYDYTTGYPEKLNFDTIFPNE